MQSEPNAPGTGHSVFNRPPRSTVAPSVAGGAAAQAPTAHPALSDAERIRLEAQRRSGAGWFYWIAGLSLINAVLALSGQGWRFFLGLGITQLVQEVAEQSGGAGVKAGVVGLAAIAVFAVLGHRAALGHRWAFVLGMALYGLDGCILLLAQDWVGAGFHGFALVMINCGYGAAKRLPSPAD
jgi:hypothetical protein